MALIPLHVGRKYASAGSRKKSGVVIWECPNSEAIGWVDALRNAGFPGASGRYAPRCYQANAQLNARPGKYAWVTALYRTPRQEGVAWWSGDTVQIRTPLALDQDGKPMTGNVDGLYAYRQTAGFDFTARRYERYVVQTAVRFLDMTKYRAYLGHVSEDNMPNLGNATAGTVLLWAIRFKRAWEDDALWAVDFEFLMDPNGWNNSCRVQKMVQMAEKLPVFERDTDTGDFTFTGDYTTKLIWAPGFKWNSTTNKLEAAEVETRKPYPTKNFGEIDRMIDND